MFWLPGDSILPFIWYLYWLLELTVPRRHTVPAHAAAAAAAAAAVDAIAYAA